MTETELRPAKIPLWLVYSLLSLFCFGMWGVFATAASRQLSPWFLKVPTRQLSPWEVQVFSTIGMLPVAIAAALSKNLTAGNNRPRGVAWALFTGAATAAANIALYAALGRGAAASIVFPLTGMYPLVTILTAWLFLRERVGRVQQVGIGLALVAILLFNLVVDDGAADGHSSGLHSSTDGMLLALLCLFGWGVTGVTLKLATRDISTSLSIVCFIAANFLVLPAIAGWHDLHWNAGWFEWTLCLALGLASGAAAQLLFAAYAAGGKVSIVSVLTALYPAIAVVCAVPLFGEKISIEKGIAIAISLAAAAVLSYQSSASPS